MPLPGSQDYKEALQAPADSLADTELREARAVIDTQGKPAAWTGSTADVYQLAAPAAGRAWAVKCWVREVPELREHYHQVRGHLEQLRLPCLVDCTFLEQGVRVRGEWYPALKMPWVRGLPLHQWVARYVDQPEALQQLAWQWLALAAQLREANVVHGDLQHAHILVSPLPGPESTGVTWDIKLLDYDGLCVPGLTPLRSAEAGHPAYQHPQRLREGTFSLAVDRFSHLVIHTALRGLAAGGRALWQRYDTGDNLMFDQEDFEAPDNSPLLQELLRSPDDEVRRLAEAIRAAARGPVGVVPSLEDVLAPPAPVLPPPPEEPGLVPLAPTPEASRTPQTWSIDEDPSGVYNVLPLTPANPPDVMAKPPVTPTPPGRGEVLPPPEPVAPPAWQGQELVPLLPVTAPVTSAVPELPAAVPARTEPEPAPPVPTTVAGPTASLDIPPLPVRERPRVERAVPARRCLHCGRNNEPGASRCAYCGERIGRPRAEDEWEDDPEDEPSADHEQVPPGPGHWKVLVVLFGVLALAGGTAGYFIWGHPHTEPTRASEPSRPERSEGTRPPSAAGRRLMAEAGRGGQGVARWSRDEFRSRFLGQTKDDVRAVLGKPDEVVEYSGTPNLAEAWVYRSKGLTVAAGARQADRETRVVFNRRGVSNDVIFTDPDGE